MLLKAKAEHGGKGISNPRLRRLTQSVVFARRFLAQSHRVAASTSPTDTISRLCQTPSGSVTSCCGKHVNTRAAAMLMSYGPSWPHLTHSCDTIHIPAALSLPPYQCHLMLRLEPPFLVLIYINSITVFPFTNNRETRWVVI